MEAHVLGAVPVVAVVPSSSVEAVGWQRPVKRVGQDHRLSGEQILAQLMRHVTLGFLDTFLSFCHIQQTPLTAAFLTLEHKVQQLEHKK